MTLQDFIKKWKASTLKERSASQEHFIDICRLLGQKTPAEADPAGEWYTFEKGATKQGGGEGWADVWMKGHFAWEYKGKHKNLEAAYKQLLRYRESLANPPLLVVCDMEQFQIHTNFTGTVKKIYRFDLDGLADEANRRVLRSLFESPDSLSPETKLEEVTEAAARELASLAQRLRDRGHDPQSTAHFLNRLLFCLFAEDVGLLPQSLFQKILDAGRQSPSEFVEMLGELFAAMAKGGRFGVDRVHFFNGNLFQDAEVVDLTTEEIQLLERIARLDWSQIEPAIFGTLFERGLDPAKRSQLGAHYTDRRSILRVVEPVLMDPLRRQWAETRLEVDDLRVKAEAAKNKSTRTRLLTRAKRAIDKFRIEVLDPIRVLDPACGSGNFLYVALELLHKLEKEVLLARTEIEHGQASLSIRVGPHMVRGIEISPFAQELAQVTIWIGHFQWQIKNGFSFETNPVLAPLDNIVLRDAIVDLSEPDQPSEPAWPDADVIVGNPPFLGGKRQRSNLGDEYVDAMFRVYDGRVPREADLVTYWFEKARAQIEAGRLKRAGLLGTNSIRGGASRRILDRIRQSGQVFMAWSDEPWIVEGAAVRISLVGFDGGEERHLRLDGQPVAVIHSDLRGSSTASGAVDLTRSRRLVENGGVAFQGPVKVGPFDVPGDVARSWLQSPLNPHGRPNADVTRPWANALDVTRRPRDMWIIDFGADTPEADAALYEAPFEYVRAHVKPKRDANRDKWRRTHWWLHGRSGEDLRAAIAPLKRYIATPRVAKHRLFVWLDASILPDSRLYAIARDDDEVMGVLHSRIHEIWTLATCSWHGVGNDPTYNAASCFETFPFPPDLAPLRTTARTIGTPSLEGIAGAARRLLRLRDNWLNPPDLVRRQPEIRPGFPERLIPVNDEALAELRKRTMTALYNDRPAWLDNAHAELDLAVAGAYGWSSMPDDAEILSRLLRLNLERGSSVTSSSKQESTSDATMT